MIFSHIFAHYFSACVHGDVDQSYTVRETSFACYTFSVTDCLPESLTQRIPVPRLFLILPLLVCSSLFCSVLFWPGLVWSGVICSDLVCIVRSALVWSVLVCSGLFCSVLFWSGLICSVLVWSGLSSLVVFSSLATFYSLLVASQWDLQAKKLSGRRIN